MSMFLINPYRFSGGGGGDTSPGQAHRYWRIQINDVFSGTDAFVRRLAFLESLDSTEVVNTGGTPDASVDSGDAANAFTDNSNSWAPTGNTFPIWLSYDFGAGNDRQCAAIRYYGSDFAGTNAVHPIDFDIQWSDNGVDWTTEWSSTYLTGWGEAWYVGNPEFETSLTNNGFEDGDLTGWTTSGGTMSVGTADDGANAPYIGTYLAHIATGVGDTTIYQDVDVSSLSSDIDQGSIEYLGLVSELQWASTDTANLTLRFLDGADAEISNDTVSNNSDVDDWQQLKVSGAVPVDTRTIRFELAGTDTSGGSTATVSFDEALLFLKTVNRVSVQAINRYIVAKPSEGVSVQAVNRYVVAKPS